MTEREQIKKNRELLLKTLADSDAGKNKYKKGKGCLHLVEGKLHTYCCLGVASDLFKDSDVKVGYCKELGVDDLIFYSGRHAVAPNYVIKSLGLRDEKGSLIDIGLHSYSKRTITQINDSSNSFEPVIKAFESGEYWKPLSDFES